MRLSLGVLACLALTLPLGCAERSGTGLGQTETQHNPSTLPVADAALGSTSPAAAVPAQPEDRNTADSPTAQSITVHPGEDIQAALDRAAEQKIRRVVVRAGTYRPSSPRQSLIWFNARHDGIELVADGEVILTSANASVSDPKSPSHPSIANHVIYFGDGINEHTVLRGFRITGARNFVTRTEGPEIQPNLESPRLAKTVFFYTDGGGIKIFGRSYPTIENCVIYDNYSSPCGAGISIEHRGYTLQSAIIRNCEFRNNRAPLTGCAVDLLDEKLGSSAILENCLFVDNLSNEPQDELSRRLGSWRKSDGHGAMTVFPWSKATVRRCTFVGNRNGVDDLGPKSVYENCIFWNNAASGGWATAPRYELDVSNTAGVAGTLIGGHLSAAMSAKLDPRANVLDAPDPEFDDSFTPRNSLYERAGYRKPAPEVEVPSHRTPTAPPPGQSSQRPSALRIHATAGNFQWHFEYELAGVGGQETGPKSLRHLILPAQVPVEVQLTSLDYLYTLQLPVFGLKEIAVPELTHTLRFTAASPGVSELIGDQLCGYSHPDLIGRVIVLDWDDFAQWCDSRTGPP
ncbi:MAG: right-handed parallel beta-helix repeat-containing protein [Pirellulales bacterium]